MYGLRFNMTVFQLRADDICLDIFKSMLLNKKKTTSYCINWTTKYTTCL